MSALSSADILAAIRERLAEWARDNRARVCVAKDPFDVLESLFTGPSGLVLCLHWAGETQLGDMEALPLVTHRVEVNVGFVLPPEARRGEALLADRANRPSLLGLVAQIRDAVSGLLFPENDTSRYPRYMGTDPVITPDGWPQEAYRLSFELDAARPPVSYREM